jgi:hypothetical protein
LQPGLVVPIEAIDQAVGVVKMSYDETKPEGQKGHIWFELRVLRMTKDFDWVKHCKANVPGLVEVKHAGRVYYNAPQPSGFSPEKITPADAVALGIINRLDRLFLSKHSLFMPDARTIVFDPKEENVRRLLERGPVACPEYVWAEGWKQVAQGVFVLTLDNRNKYMSGHPRKEEDADLDLVLDSHSRLIWGIENFDDFQLKAFAKSDTEKDAEKVLQQMKGLLSAEKTAPQQADARKPDNPAESLFSKLGHDLAQQYQIERQGTEVRFQSKAETSLAALIEILLKAIQQEAKE